MSLGLFFDEEDIPIQTVAERIKQRRCQMLVHSYLYYGLDTPIVSDGQWQSWADDLVELQKTNLHIGFYDSEFKDWDGSTGCHLPHDNWTKNKSKYLCTLIQDGDILVL
jgi:hypothetical protein